MPNIFRILAVAGLILSASALAASQSAPKDCDDAAKWAAYLADEYGERFIRTIVVGDDTPAQLWADIEEGDWTILTSGGEGVLCTWGYGEAWPMEWR